MITTHARMTSPRMAPTMKTFVDDELPPVDSALLLVDQAQMLDTK